MKKLLSGPRARRVQISLSDRQYARLRAEAASERTTVAKVIASLLDEYVDLAAQYFPVERRRPRHREEGQ